MDENFPNIGDLNTNTQNINITIDWEASDKPLIWKSQAPKKKSRIALFIILWIIVLVVLLVLLNLENILEKFYSDKYDKLDNTTTNNVDLDKNDNDISDINIIETGNIDLDDSKNFNGARDDTNNTDEIDEIDEIETGDIYQYQEELFNYLSDSVATSNIKMNQKNWLYKIWWSSFTVNGVSSYSLYPLEKWEVTTSTIEDEWWVSVTMSIGDYISISSQEYEWINDVKDFSSNIYLYLVFSEWKIVNWTIVDAKTKKNLWQLKYDELDKIYNFETKYPIKEIEFNKWFKLSDLEENVVYKYVLTPKDTESFWIENDLDYDVIVYEKKENWFRDEYLPTVYFAHDGDDWWTRSYSDNQTVYMIYQKATKEDIVYVLDPLYLSKYKHWEEIDIWSEDYLYNDTDNALEIVFIDESFWEKKEKERILLNPWEIYEKGPFIKYLIIN